MTINMNGYTEKDLKEDYDRGILDGYGMAIADFNTAVERLFQEIEDPPKLKEVAIQIVNKLKVYVDTHLEDSRDHLLVALIEKPN